MGAFTVPLSLSLTSTRLYATKCRTPKFSSISPSARPTSVVLLWSSALMSSHSRELPCFVHRRKGIRLQGIIFPPRHPPVHVPGWRLHQPQRNRRKVHLRQQV